MMDRDESMELEESDWSPVDLTPHLRMLDEGGGCGERPTVGQLSGSVVESEGAEALLYRGRVNGIAGESGAGKSFAALAIAAQILQEGRGVVYIDLEDSPLSLLSRLRTLGVPSDCLLTNFVYIRPETPLDASARVSLGESVGPEVDLVVIDSTGESLALEGANPNADEEVANWFRIVPRFLAKQGSGPAVLLLDHAPKSEGRKNYPVGSHRKRAAIDGAQFMLETSGEPFARGRPGHSNLRCVKDRHGWLQHDSLVARMVVSPGVGESVTVQFEQYGPWGVRDDSAIKARICSYLDDQADEGSGPTQTSIRTEVEGSQKLVIAALKDLVRDGYVVMKPGPGRAQYYRNAPDKPFHVE